MAGLGGTRLHTELCTIFLDHFPYTEGKIVCWMAYSASCWNVGNLMNLLCVGDATHGNNGDMVTEETGLCRTKARSWKAVRSFLMCLWACQLAVAVWMAVRLFWSLWHWWRYYLSFQLISPLQIDAFSPIQAPSSYIGRFDSGFDSFKSLVVSVF